MVAHRSDFAEDRLHIVAVGVEHEGGVVAWRITFGGVAKPRRSVVDPAGLDGGRVEGVNLRAVPGREGRVLLRSMGMKAVDPENRVIGAIADAIGPVVLRKLHDPVPAKCAQSRIVKGRRPGDVCDTDARMVDHDDKSYSVTDLVSHFRSEKVEPKS
jgi:hypothetical protein